MQRIQRVVGAEAIARLYQQPDAERSQILRRRLIEDEHR